MWRTILGVVVGLVAWVLVVTLLDIVLRWTIPGYASVEHALTFTLTMKIARLTIAAATSLIAGAIVRMIAPASKIAPWVVGLILLAFFVPVHVQIGTRLPLWYHLTFLLTLAPLVALGSRLIPNARTARVAT
jgi:hypothetical protein